MQPCRGCDELYDRQHSGSKYCSEDCKRAARLPEQPFTREMLEELYEDALNGNIMAWHGNG